MNRPGSIRGNVARTSRNADAALADAREMMGKIDLLVSETRDLVFAVRELVNAIREDGLRVGAEVAGIEIPAVVTVKTENGE